MAGLGTAAHATVSQAERIDGFMQAHSGAPCLYTIAKNIASQRPVFEGYGGQETAIPNFTAAFQRAVGISAAMNIKPIMEAQCPAVDFLRQFSKDAGRKPLKISAEARKRLEHHDWPGNIRELRNLLERVAYLCPNDKVDAADLAFILRPAKADGKQFGNLNLADATDGFQREHIQQAIEKAGGHMGEAAKILGLHRPNLYRKMRMLGMEAK